MKFDIPSATSMADLAEQKKRDFETAVMKGPVYRDILQRIESAAIEGRTAITVIVQDLEHRQAINVVSKYLREAGYEVSKVYKTFPFNLISEIKISWGPSKNPERR